MRVGDWGPDVRAGADNPNAQNITSFCVLAAFEAMHFS